VSDVIFYLPPMSDRADELLVETVNNDARLSISVCAAAESRSRAVKLNTLEVAVLRDVLSRWLAGHGW